MLADELWSTLLRFHREIAIPDIHAIVEAVREELVEFKRETSENFDRSWHRLDRLETEYHAVNAAVARVEQRLASVEAKLQSL